MAVLSVGELSVTLQRDGTREPFGFRLRGGSDIKEAFIIQRVVPGSPADGEVRRGDVLTKINSLPCAKMTHQEASEMIKNAGPTITITLHRAPTGSIAPASLRSADSSSVANQRAVTTLSGQPVARKISDIMLSPIENLPVTIFPSSQVVDKIEDMDRDRERIVVTHQPYRTTPLVLPGAKVGRDTATTTQCYLSLQGQNNPMLWTAPAALPPQMQQDPAQVLLKQKEKVFDPEKGWRMEQQEQLEAAAALVQRNLAQSAANEAVLHGQQEAPAAPKQEVVHKQFNSPLGLYSKENVEEVLALQSGLIPPNPTRQTLDLKYSETLRALRETETNQQQQNRDARGLKEVRPAAPMKVVASNPHFKVNVMGLEKEKIQQSYSFKRLMADVLGETDF